VPFYILLIYLPRSGSTTPSPSKPLKKYPRKSGNLSVPSKLYKSLYIFVSYYLPSQYNQSSPIAGDFQTATIVPNYIFWTYYNVYVGTELLCVLYSININNNNIKAYNIYIYVRFLLFLFNKLKYNSSYYYNVYYRAILFYLISFKAPYYCSLFYYDGFT